MCMGWDTIRGDNDNAVWLNFTITWGETENHFTNDLWPHFKFNCKFVEVVSDYWQSDCYRILHMSRQLGCRVMCKIFSVAIWHLKKSKSKMQKPNFTSNLRYDMLIVCETVVCALRCWVRKIWAIRYVSLAAVTFIILLVPHQLAIITVTS